MSKKVLDLPLRFASLAPRHLFDIFWIESQSFDDPWSMQSFQDLLAQNHYGGLGAFLNQVLVGYCFYYWVSDEVNIVNIAVSPIQRQKGIACALIKALQQWMTDNQCNKIFLEVSVNNANAIKLYTKMGFSKQMRRSNYYQSGEDAWLMDKALNI